MAIRFVIGAHAGPGAVAVAFFQREKSDNQKENGTQRALCPVF